MKTKVIHSPFAEEVLNGLQSSPKRISSKYFYDERGDQLFQSIMGMKEYYLTRSEYEILSQQKTEIVKRITDKGKHFNLIEFGAGDGYKTKVLLSHLVKLEIDFTYVPIDISSNVLNILSEDLHENIPGLKVKAIEGEYFQALKELNRMDDTRKVILFMGSNIGNFTMTQSEKFLSELNELCNKNDQLLIGFDLKKDPQIILNAYGDPTGITKAFNLNLLTRINRELDADFDTTAFDHFPMYDPVTGTTKSFLISTREQVVNIQALELQVKFKAWEVIHTEISQKFDPEMIRNLADKTNFKVEENFYDCKHYYLDSLWTIN